MKQKRREIVLDRPSIFQKFSGHAEHTTVAAKTVQTDDRTSTPVCQQYAAPCMDLFDVPKILPVRLTRLLPRTLACELRCVPVGCSSHALTVAMADPTNADSVQRLEAVTGMTIFPVSCDEDDLNVFLTVNW